MMQNSTKMERSALAKPRMFFFCSHEKVIESFFHYPEDRTTKILIVPFESVDPVFHAEKVKLFQSQAEPMKKFAGDPHCHNGQGDLYQAQNKIICSLCCCTNASSFNSMASQLPEDKKTLEHGRALIQTHSEPCNCAA